jgi:membrane protease YdiL (CAAX protease family)
LNSPTLQIQKSQNRAQLIAPLWHTLVLIAGLLLVSASSAYFHSFSPGLSHLGPARYLVGIAWEWAIIGFIWWGIRKRGFGLSYLTGRRWQSFTDILRDLGIAVGFLLASYVILGWLAYQLKPGRLDAVQDLIPHSPIEILFYIGLSISAGITEEIMFRGYLQRQLSAFSGSVTLAVIVQGVLFGTAHGYQGTKRMVILAVFGCLFGVLTTRRHSLKPGMVAHGLNDILVGLVWALAKH